MGGGCPRTLAPEGGAADRSKETHLMLGLCSLLQHTIFMCVFTNDATEHENFLVIVLGDLSVCHILSPCELLKAVCFRISSHRTARMGVLSWTAVAVLLTGHNYVR